MCFHLTISCMKSAYPVHDNTTPLRILSIFQDNMIKQVKFTKLNKFSTNFSVRNSQLVIETYVRILSIKLPIKRNITNLNRFTRVGPTITHRVRHTNSGQTYNTLFSVWVLINIISLPWSSDPDPPQDTKKNF